MNMKKVKQYLYIILALCFAGCQNDKTDLSFLENAQSPTNIQVVYDISDDNSGLVEMKTTGDNVTHFDLFFGDDTQSSEQLSNGETIDHTYAEEGTYTVTTIGYGVNGTAVTNEDQLVIAYRVPENFTFSVTPSGNDNLTFTATASADYAAYINIYFGENADEFVQIMPGETVTYTYSSTGEFIVTFVAESGGAANVEETLTINVVDPLVVPIDFESPTVNYQLNGFGGTTAMVIDNPDTNGNSSSKVAAYTKAAGAEVWAGAGMNLDEAIDFGNGNGFSLNVWSPRANVPILLKIEENGNTAVFAESNVSTTVANAWETLTFNISSHPNFDAGATYNIISIFYDFGANGLDETAYFDNIEQVDLFDPLTFPIDYEGTNTDYALSVFGGVQANSVIANPDMSGNNSFNVLEWVDDSGSEVWAGGSYTLPTPMDFNANPIVSFKVWSPVQGATFKLKFESSQDFNTAVEIDQVTTTSNAWEVLTFDFSGTPYATVFTTLVPDNMVIFPNFGVAGDDSTYYIDNIVLGTQTLDGASTAQVLPLDFESTVIPYSLNGFGSDTFGPIPTGVIDNPDTNGNSSSKVGFVEKTAGAQVWAGLAMPLDSPINFASTTIITMKVWSPRSGVPIRLKIEDVDSPLDANGNPTVFAEMDVNTTVANTWETLTYDLTLAPNFDSNIGYENFVLFFDFGSMGAAETFYFDDINQ